ncbi:MAG: type II toxin-antitoxin system VapC family toxin [Candidatus Riflebacteria bacterium]|nr:type II toxin-antitoxin system VapC family toxin [Candidatus Riflebacteria bacterium]
MIAVDTQVIVYHYLPGEKSELTENLIRRDSDWVTSPLWKYEFRNVLAGFIRKKLVAPLDAVRIAEEAEQFFLNREVLVPPARIVELMAKFPCTGYDLEFVAVAQEMGTRLVTNDGDLLKHFPRATIPLKEFRKK